MNNFQLWQTIGAVAGGFAALLGGLYLIVTRPLLKAMDIGAKSMDTGFKAVNHRLEEIEKRLGRIESKLENHTERITRLEERTALIR